MEIRVTVKRGAEKATTRLALTTGVSTELGSAPLSQLAEDAGKAALSALMPRTQRISHRRLAPAED